MRFCEFGAADSTTIPVIPYVPVSNMRFLYWWCVRYQAYVLSEIFQVDNLYNMNKVGNCVRELRRMRRTGSCTTMKSHSYSIANSWGPGNPRDCYVAYSFMSSTGQNYHIDPRVILHQRIKWPHHSHTITSFSLFLLESFDSGSLQITPFKSCNNGRVSVLS